MTEWNDQVVIGGSGFVAYRLMVEGWPHQWVTDPRITHVVSETSRKTYPGLSYEGLRISERMVLREAWPEVDGITAQIVPSDANEDTIDGFTRDAKVVASLQGSLSASSAGWNTRRVLATPGVYHLGTEAVYVTGAPTIDGPEITRGFWDSEPQDHDVIEHGNDNAVSVYNWPPTMEGRRAYLYAYGPSDASDSDGQIIWRGIVRRPPRMSSDGVSWEIEIAPITTAFDQDIGTPEGNQYKLRGIYHSSESPMMISAHLWGSGGFVRVTGFYETESDWVAAVNVELASRVAAAGSALTSLVYDIDNGYPCFRAHITDNVQFSVSVKDVVDGDTKLGARASLNGIPGSNGDTIDPGGSYVVYCGDPSGDLYSLYDTIKPPYGYPLPLARTVVGRPHFSGVGGRVGEDVFGLFLMMVYYTDGLALGAFPSNRVYLASVAGLNIDDVLVVKNGDDARMMRVTAIDATPSVRAIDVEVIGYQCIYISSDSTISPIKIYADNGNWADFVNGIITQSHAANLGKTPWITSRDVDTSSWDDIWAGYPFDDFWRHRSYHFLKQVRAKDVLAPELMATGWMARLAADGRLDVAPMPSISAQITAQWSATDDEILLPADEMAGQWPTWEAQADGLVNIAKLRLAYDPITDDFSESGDYTVRVTQSIAEHKSGDRASQTIEVRSQSVAFTAQEDSRFTFNFGFAQKAEVTADSVAAMVMPYLRAVSQDYAIITIAVPFTLFPVLVGDIVEVSSAYIPDGLGNRGVQFKKSICVGRTWELDPAANAMGTLTLYFARDSGRVAAYAPTGRVTAQTSLGSDQWTVAFGTGNLLNYCWAEVAGESITRHFAVGDAVQLVEVDSLTPTIVEGVVTVVPDADHLTLQLSAAWAPGSTLWNVRFLGPGASVPPTERQAAYCWIADVDGVYMQDAFIENFPSAREFA